ncbi:MAG: leucine-rich repeat domain-containing protein [Candidatus Helarchaeota archaeon]|nr:leucine-rich repeat domain-containing protein [Candidatus Helarchaeota archaeon]
MKELRELMEWVKLKVRRLKFFVKEGRIVDAINVMGIELGRQDRISTYPHENNFEIRFYSLSDFFKQVVSIDGIGIKADISLGDFGYSKQYFYHALKIVKDPEIGIPNKEYPLIIRNNTCSVFIAPKLGAERINLRNLVDIDIDDPNLVEELHFKRGNLIAIPDGIKQLKNLKKLHLGFNPLTQLNDSLKEIITLEELYLQCTALVNLPEWIGELKNLKILNLGVTNLNFLPESIKNLSSLEILDLECVELVNINEIPELINARSLRELNLCRTGFSNISSLKRFKNLEVQV